MTLPLASQQAEDRGPWLLPQKIFALAIALLLLPIVLIWLCIGLIAAVVLAPLYGTVALVSYFASLGRRLSASQPMASPPLLIGKREDA
jgi:hypothetical protein